MESQTFQAFVKAGPTGVSSPLYALTLTIAIRFTTAHCCFTAHLIRPTGFFFLIYSRTTLIQMGFFISFVIFVLNETA